MGGTNVAVYSAGRAWQLRIILWAAVAVGAVLAAVAGGGAATGYTAFAIALGAPAAAVLTSAGFALNHVREGGRAGKILCLVSGSLLILVGLLLARSAAGILPAIVGILLILLASLADTGER